MYVLYAVLSAVFASAVAILSKIGIEGVDSTLATAIRTGVVLLMAWGMVFLNGSWHQLGEVSAHSWLFLVISGLATGASWLFYFKALQMGPVSVVAPIDKASIALTLVASWVILQEPVTLKSILGGLLVVAGTLVFAF